MRNDRLFAFSASVQTDQGVLEQVPIEIGRDGYEDTEVSIPPNSDTTITMYPTTTIRAGATLEPDGGERCLTDQGLG